MDTTKGQAFVAIVSELCAQVGHGVQMHPIFFGTLLVFVMLTWSHFKSDFGPDTWSLAQDKPKALRALVHVMVMPLRLLASSFASAVALAVLGLLAGFAYVLWRVIQG